MSTAHLGSDVGRNMEPAARAIVESQQAWEKTRLHPLQSSAASTRFARIANTQVVESNVNMM
jgi:hypothetical protein